MKWYEKIIVTLIVLITLYTGLVYAGVTPAPNLNGYGRYTITAYNITGNDINWTDLNEFPTACPAGTFITTINDTTTCTALTQLNSNVDMNNYNLTEADEIQFSNGCNITSNSTGLYFVC